MGSFDDSKKRWFQIVALFLIGASINLFFYFLNQQKKIEEAKLFTTTQELPEKPLTPLGQQER